MLTLDTAEFEKLENAIKDFQGDAEKTINDVLHNEGGTLIQEAVRRLIPVSNRRPWKGKAPAARDGNSLKQVYANLAVTVTTQKRYQYLYFPNDGTSTQRHIGNQRFFEQGGEAVKGDIINRCVGALTNNFEKE